MKKTSIWRNTAQNTDYPCLNSEIDTEVAIIGGGITGITAAYLLAISGVRSVVLESLRIGGGTTGFSTGNLYCLVDETLQSTHQKYGLDTVRNLTESRMGAVDLIRTIVAENQIDCELTEAPFFYFAENPDNSSKVQKEAEVARDAGLQAVLTDDAELPFATAKCMKIEGQAQFNPMKYIRQLAEIVNSQHCTIYEGTKVISYEKNNEIYEIQTEQGKVTAKHLIVATHTPKGKLAIHTLLYPYREYAVAFKHQGPYKPGIFWGVDKENKVSIRYYRNGDENYVLVLGEKHKTGQEVDNTHNLELLKQYAREKFSVGELAYEWGAQHYRSADGLPTIGRPDKDSEIYIATGFSSDGLTFGTLAAQIIVDQISGKENRYAKLYDPNRHHPVQSAGRFISENVNVLLQYMKDFPGVGDADKYEEIPAGEGKVISQGGEKIAAYRDENNQLHLCSAVCTHMDCIVNWNKAEKSWDCPCHGSRFSTDGEVLEGPAILNLPKHKE